MQGSVSKDDMEIKKGRGTNKIWYKIRIVLSIAVIVSLMFGLQRLVMPKYAGDIIEGGFTEEYYQETMPHDVLMVGDCEVYESFSPVDLWREYGITSYIRGSAQQLVWQSYYLLEDALKYETPKVVVYNVQSLMHDKPMQEEYNRMALDGMRWSVSKLRAIQVSMMPDEHLIDYLLPILRYHSRITELTKDDLDYYNRHKRVTHAGYSMHIDVVPYVEGIWDEEVPENLTFGSLPMEYLDKLRSLCEQGGIRLILVKAPSVSPVWYEEQEQQVEAYAKKYGLTYINYLELLDEVGIDYDTDTYDMGLHMNLSGARKITSYLGSYLSEECGLNGHKGEMETERVWKEKETFYDKMKKELEKEPNNGLSI